ncbi:helix-turn-helix domain-containing protein [Fusobacterium necrophorum]|uniref:helix-turn-helix domain-containing protein n=1 Tax=Fusobacterium necrophorum TaxID=859 RepID=UPI00370E5BCD
MNLGEQIKKYREKYGLSQRGFSNKVNISQAYISMLEAGKPVKLDHEKLEELEKLLAEDLLNTIVKNQEEKENAKMEKKDNDLIQENKVLKENMKELIKIIEKIYSDMDDFALGVKIGTLKSKIKD